MNLMMDGPMEVEIHGDRVTARGTSDGERLTITFRLEDALISQHRMTSAHEETLARRASEGCAVLAFPVAPPPSGKKDAL